MSIYTEKAVALFREGYNCAQAVTGAFAEQFGMSQEDALRFSEGMGAGMGRLRLTCGAVSAMALLAGLKLSNGKPNDLTTRKEVYAVVQEMTKAFQEKNGSIICAELLGAARPKHETGPILLGLNAPINDLSRGCNADEVYKMAIITAALV